MVDLSKVSKAVQKFVSDVAKTEGNKKQIDSQNEYNKLGDYLAGNNDVNVHEKEFIQGFMIEFENKQKAAEQKEFEDSVTDSTKKAVDQIKKRMDNKKKIDTDDEAQALLNMLKNTRGDLNKADLEYIKRALIDAGYGALLEDTVKGEKNATEPVNKEPAQPTPPPATEPEPIGKDAPKVGAGGEKPVETPPKDVSEKPIDKPTTYPRKKTKPARKPVKPEPKPEPKIPDTPAPKPTPKPAPAPKKPTISERGRTDGIGLAQNLAHELDSTVVDNKKMRGILSQVNKENAYSFFKAFHSTTNSQVNKEVFKVSDMFNKIGYKDTARAMQALLDQAKSFGLENTPQYKALANNINFINQRVAGNPDVDPEGREALNSDNAINNLLILMGKAMV